jgi:hypothetical protein
VAKRGTVLAREGEKVGDAVRLALRGLEEQ